MNRDDQINEIKVLMDLVANSATSLDEAEMEFDAGVFTDPGVYKRETEKRAGEMSELANLATFLMADGCDYLTGETIAIDGGQHLTSSGTFAAYSQRSDEQWRDMRETIKAANAKDKAQRTVGPT